MPDITFEDLGGLKGVIEELTVSLIRPYEQPQLFLEFGVQQPSGVLLYGPSGTGKTTLAMVLAKTCKINFISIQVSF